MSSDQVTANGMTPLDALRKAASDMDQVCDMLEYLPVTEFFSIAGHIELLSEDADKARRRVYSALAVIEEEMVKASTRRRLRK